MGHQSGYPSSSSMRPFRLLSFPASPSSPFWRWTEECVPISTECSCVSRSAHPFLPCPNNVFFLFFCPPPQCRVNSILHRWADCHIILSNSRVFRSPSEASIVGCLPKWRDAGGEREKYIKGKTDRTVYNNTDPYVQRSPRACEALNSLRERLGTMGNYNRERP